MIITNVFVFFVVFLRPRTNNSRHMDKFNKLNVTGLFEDSCIYEKSHMMC